MRFFIYFITASFTINASEARSSQKIQNPILLVPHPFAGGAGDIASNLIMADLLKEADPALSIYIVLTKENEPIIKAIRPKLFYDTSPLRHPALFRPSPENPISGTVLSFSGLAGTIYPVKDVIVFEEYSGRQQDWITRHDGRWIVRTGPSGAGFYIRKNKAPTRGSLRDVTRFLNESSFFLRSPRSIPVQENVRLGFAYSDSDRASRLYLEALIEWIKKNAESHPTAVVLKNHPGLLEGLRIPEHLNIFLYNSIPLNDSEWILSHTNIPILVTGDGSLTQALEWEKPLIYERQLHKHSVSVALEQFFGDLWLPISPLGTQKMIKSTELASWNDLKIRIR